MKWLGRIIFLLCALPLTYLLFLSYFRPEAAIFLPRLEPFEMTDAQRKICEKITDDELIRAAVDSRLKAAAQYKAEGVELEKIDFPHITYDDFRASNPDCCRVSDKLSGDDPAELTPFFDGTLEPKVYWVNYTWRVKGRNANSSNLVTCYGNAVAIDQLRSYLYRSERPINWADILM
jgi:hypothetical protein